MRLPCRHRRVERRPRSCPSNLSTSFHFLLYPLEGSRYIDVNAESAVRAQSRATALVDNDGGGISQGLLRLCQCSCDEWIPHPHAELQDHRPVVYMRGEEVLEGRVLSRPLSSLEEAVAICHVDPHWRAAPLALRVVFVRHAAAFLVRRHLVHGALARYGRSLTSRATGEFGESALHLEQGRWIEARQLEVTSVLVVTIEQGRPSTMLDSVRIAALTGSSQVFRLMSLLHVAKTKTHTGPRKRIARKI